MSISAPQESFILNLASKVAGYPIRYLSQVHNATGVVLNVPRATSADASQAIDELKALLAAKG